jgi:hypothetical protein
MVMVPAGLETNNGCAGEAQQEFHDIVFQHPVAFNVFHLL